SPLSGEYPGRVVRLLLATMPSADFCIALRVSLDSLSPLPDTMQISQGKYDRLPHTTTESTLGDLDGYGLRGLRATRPPPRASCPVFFYRLVRLLHASFRPHLTVDALALCYPSPPSGWGKTFTSKLSYNARRTVTCDGPMARRHRVLGRMSEPRYQGNLSFETVSYGRPYSLSAFQASTASEYVRVIANSTTKPKKFICAIGGRTGSDYS